MKALLILAILALVVVAGCGQTAPTTGQKVAAETVKVDPAVNEATSGLVSENDDVEIGEMI